jgi:hypothetical protein
MPEHGISRKREYFYSNDTIFSQGSIFLDEPQGMKKNIRHTLSAQLRRPLPIHTYLLLYRRIGQPLRWPASQVDRKSDESAIFLADLNLDSFGRTNTNRGLKTFLLSAGHERRLPDRKPEGAFNTGLTMVTRLEVIAFRYSASASHRGDIEKTRCWTDLGMAETHSSKQVCCA